MSSAQRAVQPLKGIAPYVGGKRILSARLVEIIDAIPHRTYAEPFIGMGGVFFRRKQRPHAEAVNDISSDVATLFRVLQRHYVAFADMLRWQLTTRAEFERLVASDPGTLTDLERAARFFYLQTTCFGGKVAGRNFGVSPGEPGAFDVTRLVPQLEAYHERLKGVVIERLPYADFIRRYDRAGTLFYLDPPYLGSEHYYGRGVFGREDFGRLKGLLKGLKGRFVMTVGDAPEMRELFMSEFQVETLKLGYSVHGGGRTTPARELLVMSNG